MIIDSHCHAGKGDGLTGPWDTDAPLSAYLSRARRCGIDRTVLLPAFTSDYRTANAAIGALVRRHPTGFFGYAMVDAARDAGRISILVSEAVTGWGACGIKVHRHDGRITREVMDVARRFRLPVLYDVMGDASGIELLAGQYPDVSIIVPHLGSFADDWRAHLAVTDQLVRHPSVYADTSGVRRFDLLAAAVRRAGPAKILFGTDGPWLHPALELEKIRALGLPRRQEDLILSGNWLRVTATARRRPRNPSAGPELDRGGRGGRGERGGRSGRQRTPDGRRRGTAIAGGRPGRRQRGELAEFTADPWAGPQFPGPTPVDEGDLPGHRWPGLPDAAAAPVR